MSGDTGRQSSSEVANEAEGTRANLASTLEQLRTNLRPENVMEEVVSNARIGASTVADNIADVAKQYPIPSMLIAAGSALIMRVFTGRDAGAGIRTTRTGSAMGVPRSTMPRDPSTFAFAPEGETRASTLRRQATDIYKTTSAQAGDAMQSLSRYVPHDRREVKSKLSNLLDEQPLLLGVIGLAVGAAIGAALPTTETEDNLMGSTAHRLRDTATDAARHEIDGLRAAAGQAVDNVRHSATENLNDFVKDVGDNAKTVVGKAGDSLAPGARDV